MADEPVLCFDGDNAGLRAAYRAVDLALPRLKPGKSLKFALLPQGPGPRRSAALGRARGGRRSDRGGAPARRHAVGARDRRARRSTRRSGARRSKRASTRSPRGIGDEAVRKYYRQDFSARLAQFFAPAQAPGRERGGRPSWRGQQDWRNRRDARLAAARWAAGAPGARRQSRALCGGEPAARREPGACAATAAPCRCARR